MEGRKAEPTGSVIDTQSVKTSTNVPVASQGTDAAKEIVGRKRGILTDTIGLILAVSVTAASLSDDALGIDQPRRPIRPSPRAGSTSASRGPSSSVARSSEIDVEVVDRNPGVRGFHVVKGRWVVERSIDWIMMHRRLARDASSEA